MLINWFENRSRKYEVKEVNTYQEIKAAFVLLLILLVKKEVKGGII
jgi:hypothetical protein